jgi:hypothetical protein
VSWGVFFFFSHSSPHLPESDAIVVAAEKKRKFGRIIEETQKRSIDVGITLESNHDRKRSDKKITKPPRKSEWKKRKKKQYSNQSGYIKEGVCTHKSTLSEPPRPSSHQFIRRK